MPTLILRAITTKSDFVIALWLGRLPLFDLSILVKPAGILAVLQRLLSMPFGGDAFSWKNLRQTGWVRAGLFSLMPMRMDPPGWRREY
jgi:hypothetical protein